MMTLPPPAPSSPATEEAASAAAGIAAVVAAAAAAGPAAPAAPDAAMLGGDEAEEAEAEIEPEPEPELCVVFLVDGSGEVQGRRLCPQAFAWPALREGAPGLWCPVESPPPVGGGAGCPIWVCVHLGGGLCHLGCSPPSSPARSGPLRPHSCTHSAALFLFCECRQRD